MATPTDKQKAREFNKSKRSENEGSGGVMRKIGSGKKMPYIKAAMLTAGLMAQGGPKGASAFDKVKAGDQQQTHKEERVKQQASQQLASEFEEPTNPEIKKVNFGSGQQSQGKGSYYADGSPRSSGGIDEQGRAKELSMPGGGRNPLEVAQVKPRDLGQEARLGLNQPQARQGSDGSASDMSKVSPGDQAATRRRLNSEKLQSKNEDKNEASGEVGAQAGKTAGAAIGASRFGKPGQGDGGKVGEKVGEEVDKSLRGRWQKVQNERKNIKANKDKMAGAMEVGDQGKAAAIQAANKAIQQAYSTGQSVIEGLIFDGFLFIFLIGLPYFILWFARPLLAMIGMLKKKIFGVEVNLVPGYSFRELILVRLLPFFGILGIFLIEWFALWVLYEQIMNPGWFYWTITKLIAGEAVKSVWSWF
ncbi:MAG: hypothetical protein Q8P20_00720 [bacterium]|nr:hypothetical protein [bacterium]